MAQTGAAIRDVYRQGIEEIGRIVGSTKSTQEQITAATQSLDDLTAMMLSHTIETVQGRTALLSGLIVELSQVIEKININPPYQGTLNALTTVLGTANALLSEEKKHLI